MDRQSIDYRKTLIADCIIRFVDQHPEMEVETLQAFRARLTDYLFSHLLSNTQCKEVSQYSIASLLITLTMQSAAHRLYENEQIKSKKIMSDEFKDRLEHAATTAHNAFHKYSNRAEVIQLSGKPSR